MKIIAHQVVRRENTVAVPRGPKAVWLPIPPKVAAISALLLCCSSTTTISTAQTITCTMVIKTLSICNSGSFQNLVRKGGFEPPRLSAPPPQDGVSASSTTSALGLFAPTSAERRMGEKGNLIITNSISSDLETQVILSGPVRARIDDLFP